MDACCWTRGRSSPTASRAAPTPRRTGARARAGAWTHTIADQFEQWFAESGDSPEPWCTTVSFVNPHDIAWWHKWTERVPSERSAPALVRGLPPNYETPEMLEAHNKPLLQLSLQQTAAKSFGPVPFTGPDVTEAWTPFFDLYVKLQRTVDAHVGQVLRTLESRPEVAANTVVVFTSDHGEYGASHGLRGKGGGAYEEAIRVPLIVKDPRGVLTAATGRPRTQLTSSVDVAPLLLSDRQRLERVAAGATLRAPRRPGGPRGDPRQPARAGAPVRAARDRRDRHGVRDRTVRGRRAAARGGAAHGHREVRDVLQLGPKPGSSPEQEGQERELYDYRTRTGRMELDNVAAARGAAHSRLEGRLQRRWSGRCARSCAARCRGTWRTRRGWASRTTC